MDSIDNILRSKNTSEPPQVSALKRYVKDNHDTDISVRVSSKAYVITVPNAALAHKMRVETREITHQCKLEKRLVIHIGS